METEGYWDAVSVHWTDRLRALQVITQSSLTWEPAERVAEHTHTHTSKQAQHINMLTKSLVFKHTCTQTFWLLGCFLRPGLSAAHLQPRLIISSVVVKSVCLCAHVCVPFVCVKQPDTLVHTHATVHTDPLRSPDPEKLSRALSATEEAISLLLIGSVLTANKTESHCHRIIKKYKLFFIFSKSKKKKKNPKVAKHLFHNISRSAKLNTI